MSTSYAEAFTSLSDLFRESPGQMKRGVIITRIHDLSISSDFGLAARSFLERQTSTHQLSPFLYTLSNLDFGDQRLHPLECSSGIPPERIRPRSREIEGQSCRLLRPGLADILFTTPTRAAKRTDRPEEIHLYIDQILPTS